MKKVLQLTLIICALTTFSCEDNHHEYLPKPPADEFTSALQEKPSNTRMTTSRKFLLVHGAWHPEGSWFKIVKGLERLGHQVFTVQLPGLGTDKTAIKDVTLASHVNVVTKKMREIGRGIILVGHSYGGVVISQAAENLSSHVDLLIYVSAFLLSDGQNLLDIASLDTESIVTQNIIINGDSVYIPESSYIDAFYNLTYAIDKPRLELDIELMTTLLVPQPLKTFTTPVSLGSNFKKIKKIYIACLLDQAITPRAQRYMCNQYPDIIIRAIRYSDHSPFLSRPQKLIELLTAI
ncbi:alpha/beta fold hydrolase [Fulvivirga sediminis]|uniref:Alpha/beta fold hydrolase n=1 Tax=Fulvivirga sediminis TaxID=2803949 RepID=A0A937F8N1_9BACT|nr:alpha/beta fold hydrolase [Fulvivirga sediminis]MBL3656314.1 alpha/beta fold hydrolase [Fulvivirga sediminis]